jgi:hypothetical protein
MYKENIMKNDRPLDGLQWAAYSLHPPRRGYSLIKGGR